ncbi:MAG: hypothetical protein C0506_08280 [Anaerolinea sp.]|nr:hypothetical protein [Anaerolinea sp.]
MFGTLLGLTLPLGLVAPAAAQPAPGGGPEFGQHVAEMAPDHPTDHGREFGRCVSELAKRGECGHH